MPNGNKTENTFQRFKKMSIMLPWATLNFEKLSIYRSIISHEKVLYSLRILIGKNNQDNKKDNLFVWYLRLRTRSHWHFCSKSALWEWRAWNVDTYIFNMLKQDFKGRVMWIKTAKNTTRKWWISIFNIHTCFHIWLFEWI